MKTGDKVVLKLDLRLVPLNASTPRGALQTQFKQGDVFELVSVSGEQATVKDTNGNFWSVLMEFLGLVQEVAHVGQNTTIGEGIGLGKRIVNWFKSLGNIKLPSWLRKK